MEERARHEKELRVATNNSRLCGRLGAKNLCHAIEGVNFLHWLVGTEAEDTGKAERIAAVVAIALHDVVEGNFDDDLWFDGEVAAVGFHGMLEKPVGHGEDFLIGKPAVGFADVAQAGTIAHGKRVVAQDSSPPAVTQPSMRRIEP